MKPFVYGALTALAVILLHRTGNTAPRVTPTRSAVTVKPITEINSLGKQAPLVLAREGKALYVIALADDAISAEQTAAQELSQYLEKMSGAPFAVKPESEVLPEQAQILVGAGARVRKLAPMKWDNLGDDAIVVKTVGKNLVLAGDRPRGTLYACYSLLEEVLGCRWWSASEETIPSRRTLTIPRLNTYYTPSIKVREALYRFVGRVPEFVVKMKWNGHYYGLEDKYGSNIRFIPEMVHTFYKLLPPEVYFEKHPEWYSEIDGKRVSTPGFQLCLTNPEMRKEITRVLLEKLRAEKDPRLVSLSQNDSFVGNCQCPVCKAIDDREGTPAGSLVEFVNAVAAEVEKEFPRVKVETLAYNYSRTPPKTVRPRENVIIRLVGGVGCTYEQPLDSDANALFRDQATKWSAIAPNLFFWDYTTNFTNYLVPHPNLQVLAPNIRFFAKNHTWGVFAHGDSGSLSGDFVRLKAWLIAHLLWNPELDDKQLRQQFIYGYYGKAGPYIDKYLDLLTSSFLKRDIRLTSSGAQLSYMSLAQMNEATGLFDKAEAAVANDPVVLHRVRRERVPLDHVWLLRYADLKRIAAMQNIPFNGPQDPEAAVESLIKKVRDEDNGDGFMYTEGMRFSQYEPMLRQVAVALKTKAVPPVQTEALAPTDWVDIQDHQFTLQGGEPVNDPLASDGKATKPHSPWCIMIPFSGDLLEFWDGSWRVYISARIPGEDKGKVAAFSAGIHDYGTKTSTHTNIMSNTVKDDNYNVYDLGSMKLNYSKALWITWEDGNAKDVFIDRVFLVKETSPAVVATNKP
jgi:hypothetical protein